MMGLGLLLGRLNLTDAQRTQVRDVMDRHQEETRAAQIKMREAREALRKAVETVPLDEGLVLEKADAVGRLEGDLAVLRARIHSEVYALLTAEQRTTAAQITAEREARMKQREEQLRQQRQQRPQS
jgi:Spy/CpxP family protein refolding chaperone